jgi:hypothetical protein
MKTSRILAGLAAVAIGTVVAGAPVDSAQAGDWVYSSRGVPIYKRGARVNPGVAAAAGIVGGHAAGAAIAGAVGAPPPPAYYPPPEPVYVSPPPGAIYAAPGPECYQARQKVWVPGWGWEWRRTTVCDD